MMLTAINPGNGISKHHMKHAIVYQISEALEAVIEESNADNTQATINLPKEEDLNTWVNAALTVCGKTEDEHSITIRIASSEESQALNHQYRHKDKPTNVLSFTSDIPSFVEITPRPLGDLVLCYDIVEKEFLEQNKPPMNHWAHLIIHGCLHLLGYDHQDDDEAKNMEAIEIKLLDDMGIKNPYI